MIFLMHVAFSGARLPFDDYRLARAPHIKVDVVEVRRQNERVLGHPFSGKYFLYKAFHRTSSPDWPCLQSCAKINARKPRLLFNL